MDPWHAEHRIAQLTKELHEHNYRYYVLSQPVISDLEFDRQLKELEELEQRFPQWVSTDSPTKRVGGEVTKEFKTVRHKFAMLSLSNTYSKAELEEFDKRTRKLVAAPFEYVCELKYDGVAIGLTYENGRLRQAVTRGDGEQGDDVTANVKTIKSIPLLLRGQDYPDLFEIRGEIFIPKKGFERLNEERMAAGETAFANPRNAASGSLKLLHSALVAERPLDCFLYYMLGDNLPYDNHYDNLVQAREWGLKVPQYMVKCRDLHQVYSFIDEWSRTRYELPFDIDGVVVKVNQYGVAKQLGYTAKSPRWAVAYKYQPESATTRLISISYQVGRTGAITPVANLAPIQLAGTTVKRASLHNADVIKGLDVRIGDQVYVEKGGDIIPKITGVDLAVRPAVCEQVAFVTTCPQCHTPLIRKDGEAQHYCPNENGCPPQLKGRVEHFISRKAMNIDSLGEGRVEILFDKGLVREAADLYDLTFEQMFGLEKRYADDLTGKVRTVAFKEKTVENILNAIEVSKQVPFDRVLFALGIRYVGETVAKKLASHFKHIFALKAATFEELIEVEEIGEKIAESLIRYFSDIQNLTVIDRLLEKGLQFKMQDGPVVRVSNILEGKSLVVSGVFSAYTREEIKDLIALHGGKHVASVSAKTHFLVAGDKMGPAKLEKAEKMGVRIVSEAEFLAMIKLPRSQS